MSVTLHLLFSILLQLVLFVLFVLLEIIQEIIQIYSFQILLINKKNHFTLVLKLRTSENCYNIMNVQTILPKISVIQCCVPTHYF